MSAIEDAVNDPNATIEAERLEVAENNKAQDDRITALEAQVDALEAQVAAGDAVTLEQLAGVKANIQGIYNKPAA